MSQEGIPLASYNKQESDINRTQAGALSTLGRSANPGAGLASIVRAGNDATGSLNAQDAVQRNRNLMTLLQERQTLAQQKDKQWDWNYQQKYLGNLAKSQSLRTSGNANISGALSDTAGTASTALKMGGFGTTGSTGTTAPAGYSTGFGYGGDE